MSEPIFPYIIFPMPSNCQWVSSDLHQLWPVQIWGEKGNVPGGEEQHTGASCVFQNTTSCPDTLSSITSLCPVPPTPLCYTLPTSLPALLFGAKNWSGPVLLQPFCLEDPKWLLAACSLRCCKAFASLTSPKPSDQPPPTITCSSFWHCCMLGWENG